MQFYKPELFDFDHMHMYDARTRTNLVTIENLHSLCEPCPDFEDENLRALCKKILEARANGRPVILFYGAHVIKCGLSLYIIDLIKRGILTHIASNGAGSIHDFELAYLGGTSEYVPRAIEDGSFGMWEQTGRWMNEAIRWGYSQGFGYGEALAHWVGEHQELFPYKDCCVFYNAYRNGVPATYHVTIGTDIIDQYPTADFACKGGASGRDFKIFTNSIKDLEGGVFMNVGSAVTGAEVFLKALSIVRNNGYETKHITTANFDMIPLGDYKTDVSQDEYVYYYRPRKNVLNRPVSLGGAGYYICGNHRQTIPKMYHLLTDPQSR